MRFLKGELLCAWEEEEVAGSIKRRRKVSIWCKGLREQNNEKIVKIMKIRIKRDRKKESRDIRENDKERN